MIMTTSAGRGRVGEAVGSAATTGEGAQVRVHEDLQVRRWTATSKLGTHRHQRPPYAGSDPSELIVHALGVRCGPRATARQPLGRNLIHPAKRLTRHDALVRSLPRAIQALDCDC